jgi:phytoene synthase
MTTSLHASYAACQNLARVAARNFYYSFWVLPKPKRRAMCALYAFFRRTDDLGDDGPIAARRAALDDWRAAWHEAQADRCRDPLLPAVIDTVRRYAIPPEYLETAIDGVASDLVRSRFATFEELSEYCYQVASVVGLACIHVWGFRQEPAAYEAAKRCGIAFQLTNILRDVGEDARLGRIYLPQAELAQFGLSDDDLRRGDELIRTRDPRWQRLFAFQLERAESYYRDARALTAYLDPDGLAVYGAMVDIYHGLLVKLRHCGGDVFSARISLPGWRKTLLAARHLLWRRPRLLGGRRVGDVACETMLP